MMAASRSLTALVLSVALMGVVSPLDAQSRTAAKTSYDRLVARERALTAQGRQAPPQRVRALIGQYQHFAGRHARTGYADNALWQAAQLAASLSVRTKSASDQATARRILQHLIKGYPSSSLVAKAQGSLRELTKSAGPRTASSTPVITPPAKASTPSLPLPATSLSALAGSTPKALPTAIAPPNVPTTPAARQVAPILQEVRRTVLPDVVRITMGLSEEVPYREARIDNPDRVAIDLPASRPADALAPRQSFSDHVARQVQLTRADEGSLRVLINLDEAQRYSVFSLYNPYRIVVDVYRAPLTPRPPRAAHQLPARPAVQPLPAPSSAPPAHSSSPASAQAVSRESSPAPLVGRQLAVWSASAELVDPLEPNRVTNGATHGQVPVAPAANASGSFSLSRQLGLGVSRIVIDPGHGGHDPGALGERLTEADLVLSIALRLEKILRKNPLLEVELTRRSNVFIPLEQRTAIANRFGADLFLSIHANASRNPAARGVETYVLSLASSADAAAVAARENASSGRSMHQLRELVQTITMSNKLEESQELARSIQAALVKGIANRDQEIRDLGVKKAPFVVLVGANMPSVLTEISFVTNATDAQLLRTGSYRQRIAEALADALQKYQRALKATETAALH